MMRSNQQQQVMGSLFIREGFKVWMGDREGKGDEDNLSGSCGQDGERRNKTASQGRPRGSSFVFLER